MESNGGGDAGLEDGGIGGSREERGAGLENGKDRTPRWLHISDT